MKILQFRIRNFRSIIDSKWVELSADNVSVFVGQNESGKSSILEALYYSLSPNDPSEDDVRSDESLPEVWLRIEAEYAEIEGPLANFTVAQRDAVASFIAENSRTIELKLCWVNLKRPKANWNAQYKYFQILSQTN